MSRSHKVVASFELPLSHPWEYEKAQVKKPEKRAYRATLHVVIWPTLKRFRRRAKPPRRKVAAAMLAELRPPHIDGHFGPTLAELHLVVGWTQASRVAHEIAHAVAILPKKAHHIHRRGWRGEVAAYRIERITETLGQELLALGLSFLPAVARTKPLKIAKGGCQHPSCLVEIAGNSEEK